MEELNLLKKQKQFQTQSFYYRNINEMVIKTLSRLALDGEKQETRNGGAICLYDQETIMLNPLARHLDLKGRTNNIFGTIGEIFWVLSGNKELKPLLEYFVPRAPLYSDDGKTWHASYGDRLWNYDQIEHALYMFKTDGILTRRSTASIFIPHLDTYKNYMKAEGTMKDVPCNQWMNFYIQKVADEYFLNMKVNARSNDIIFGLGNINIPEFTIIQEMMLSMVRELYPEENIKLGVYKHMATNLHVYDALEKQFNSILESSTYNSSVAVGYGDDYLEAKFPSIITEDGVDVYIIKNFFKEISILLEKAIKNEDSDYKVETAVKELDDIFTSYKVDSYDNSIYVYGVLCLYYIFGKKEVFTSVRMIDFYKVTKIKTPQKVCGLPLAVTNNKFRSFDL